MGSQKQFDNQVKSTNKSWVNKAKKLLPYEKFLLTYSPIKAAFKNNKLSGRKSGRSESTHTVAKL